MAALPYADADSSLRALAGRAEGFGRFAVGGLHGPLYCVTTLADALLPPHYHLFLILLEPDLLAGLDTVLEFKYCGDRISGVLNFEWEILIIQEMMGLDHFVMVVVKRNHFGLFFEVSGTIHLSSYLNVSSYKTIDGRGRQIKLTGKGLRLKDCEHVIICNLKFEGGRGHDVDGIQIKPNSRHIWIDRCSLRDYDDGLIDITRQSTDITVSRCHFAQHDKTMLIGADPSHIGDRCIRVTIHHCFFDGTRQRHPRLRFGKVHLYNNYTRNWGIYAVCASVESQIFSQCNIYEAGQKKKTFEYYTEKAADKQEAKSGLIRSEGDLFLNGAQSCLLNGIGEECVFHASEYYPIWTMEAASDSLRAVLQVCTGWQSVPRPQDQVTIA
ncbi:pectin lyase-like superfamily protein [Actinidia rufa]|uniref:Pectin lyase-like superfamily protein n=1 Tax=Actinidia rufa TaxID=165716 RepID=A0A7J0E6U6_9ERIC|nr:pectin lyase-like superfamily protein [Actinidia rufa]